MAARLPGWPGPRADPAADAELLRRFAAARDEAAFEALVWRHGPAVRAVCRFALGNAADADDAFQATFLVLARKAASVREPAGVGRWLVAVAGRVARKARSRRERLPTAAEDLAVIPAPSASTLDDTGAVFDEVAKLPEKYRLPVFLVYAAGHTTADAAAILGTPKGSLLTRLAWARKVLAGRLAARGLAPAVAAATVIPLDPQLVRATVTAAAVYAAGVASLSPAVPLSDGVIRSMTAAKFTTAAGVLGAAVALTGLGVGAGGLIAADPPGTKAKVADAAPSVPRLVNPTAAPAKEPVPSGGPPIMTALDSLEDLKRQVADLRKALDAERAKPNAKPPHVLLDTPSPDTNPDVLRVMKAQIDDMLQAALAAEKKKNAPPAENTAPLLPSVTLPPMNIPPMATAPAPKPANPKAGVKEFVIGRPVGVWHRAAGNHRFQMKFSDADSRLTVANTVITPNGPVLVHIEADYSVGKDGVIFGYITGIESTGGGDWDHLIDTPFSFRFRADDNVLTVKDVKLAGAGKDDTVLFATGRYTDQAVPPNPPPVASPLGIGLPSSSGPPTSPALSKRATPVDVPRSAVPPVATPTEGVAPTPTKPSKPPEPQPNVSPEALPPPRKADVGPSVVEAGPPINYVPKQRVVANPDGTFTYKTYYEPERAVAPAGSDPFTRPDGSSRLLGPAKQQPVPSPVPFENENPQRSPASY